MTVNGDSGSEIRAKEADRKGKESGGGGSAAIVIILLILIGIVVFFLTKKPAVEKAGVYEILPEKCAMLFRLDMENVGDQKFKDEMWKKFKENPQVQEALKDLQANENINIEEDILSWFGGEVTASFFSIPDPQKAEVNEDLIVALSIKDMEKAKAKIEELSKKSEESYKKEKYENVEVWISNDKAKPSYAFVKGFLVFGLENDVYSSIDASNKKIKNINENPQFKEAVKKLPSKVIGLLYMDMQKAMELNKDRMPMDEEANKMVQALTTFAVGVGKNGDNFEAMGFLGIKKDTDSKIVKAIYECKPALGAPSSVRLFPKDTSYYAALDIKFIYNLIMAVAKAQEGGEVQIQTGKEQFTQQTGVDLDKDIIDNLSGELAYVLDFTELLAQSMGGASQESSNKTAVSSNLKNMATGLEMWATDNGGKYPQNLDMLSPDYLKTIPSPPAGYTYLYKPESDPDHFSLGLSKDGSQFAMDMPSYDSFTGLQGDTGAAPQPRGNQPPPVVVALKAVDKTKIKTTMDKLTANFDMFLKKDQVEGIEVKKFPNDSGGLAVFEDYVLIGVGKGVNQFPTLFKNKLDESKSLASTDGYKLIKDKLNEKTISVGMVKFEKILPLMELGISMAAAQQGQDQAEAAKQMLDLLKQYNEIWTYSDMEDGGFSFHAVVMKNKTESDK